MQQQFGDFQIVAIAGPLQRGGSVAFGGVDVHFGLEQRADGREVAVFGGFYQRQGAGLVGLHQAASQQERHQA